MRLAAFAVSGAVLMAACGGDAAERDARAPEYRYPPAPVVDSAVAGPAIGSAWSELVAALRAGFVDRAALDTLAAAGDARVAWLVGDLLRFAPPGPDSDAVVDAFVELTSVDPSADPAFADSPWRSITNHLIAWDLPAPQEYRVRKEELFLVVEPGWEPFFTDASSEIDWRLLTWGGVGIDDRPLGDPHPCPDGCIPALDDPALTPAAAGDWYPDDAYVFGIVEGGDAVALPKHIMEVHELVNLAIGGRRLGVPYCTLCASAQGYYTDEIAAGIDPLVLRTSGLLSRSNKVMYDLHTGSVFDTFTGRAVSGPLLDAGMVLAQTTVVTSTWAEWRTAHPATSIVAEDGGIGRAYPDDPLGGRDDDGPIFPTGPVDLRLPVQAAVVGVVTDDGAAVAFPVDAARAALSDGRVVALAGVELHADGGGFRARSSGREVAAHEAFWFAWSQFHPGTDLWTPIAGS